MFNLYKSLLGWWRRLTLHIFVGKEHRRFRKHFRIRCSRRAEVVLNCDKGRWKRSRGFRGRRFAHFFLVSTLLTLIVLITILTVLITILIVLITMRWAERLDSCHRSVIDVAT